MVETNRALPILSRIGIIVGVAIAFIVGLTSTVYLSLRSAEVKVPDVLGKNFVAGEDALDSAGLNIHKRASRYSADAKPDTILDQSPRAGEIVKAGQTIAVVVSRPPKEGEAVAPASEEAKAGQNKAVSNENANDNSATKNQNANKDRKSNKNTSNKNSNSRNSNNANRNANNRNTANGNANGSNANNRNANNRNASNRNVNAARNANNRNANGNRNSNSLNVNRRAPVIRTPPFNPTGNPPKP